MRKFLRDGFNITEAINELMHESGVIVIENAYNLNDIKEFPLKENQLPNLERLDLGQNRLRSISSELWNLKKLEWLNLRWLSIALPAEIRNAENLKVLDLSDSKLTHLPKEIGHLSNLKALNIEQSEIDALPPEICHCGNLEELLDNEQSDRYLKALQTPNISLPPKLRPVDTLDSEFCNHKLQYGVSYGDLYGELYWFHLSYSQ